MTADQMTDQITDELAALRWALGNSAGGAIAWALACERLPLAVYREIAAHLGLLAGVTVEILPQTSRAFDYLQSQVGGLKLTIAAGGEGDRAIAILAHYAAQFGPWRRVESVG
jgi:poly(3-hydroxybutyrate) depolymerase